MSAIRFIFIGIAAASASMAAVMPTSQQNALIQKYCAVCHTDAAKNGGLTLEHYDAATAAPSLNAMLLSKITGGILLKSIGDAPTNPATAAAVAKGSKGGAMGAAGVPVPAKPVIDALIQALAVESKGATDWNVERSKDSVTVSSLQEATVNRADGEAESYRFVASCNTATHEGSMQVAWAPVAQSGSFAAFVDDFGPVRIRVEGSESMGNHSGLTLSNPAFAALAEAKANAPAKGMPFPVDSLIVSGLFPNETVTFSFTAVPADARRDIQACFPPRAPKAR